MRRDASISRVTSGAMASDPRRGRWRALAILGAVLLAWLALQGLLHPAAPSARFCDIDVRPDADTVVMLSAAWCGYCRRARTWLVANDVRHCEYDVETQAAGRDQFAALPVKVVPVFKLRGDTLVGFNRTELEQALAAHGLRPFEE